MVAGMSRRGIYLYGFARPGAVQALEVLGVEEGEPVRAIELEGMTAVVSAVPLDAFEAASESSEPDLAWIIPRAVQHERVIEAIMATSPVLPVRFGAVFSSPEALGGLVADHREEIARFLDHVADKEEWAFKGFVDFDRAVHWLLESDPALAERRRRLAETPGVRYFQEKQIQEDARRLTKQSSRFVVDQVCAAVRGSATDILTLPLRPAETPGREMVLHLACLIPRAAVTEVLAQTRQAASAGCDALMILESSGPWPPFHFCPQLGERRS
jgi:Gas vesicle synthesis protein GvpL/GvpF